VNIEDSQGHILALTGAIFSAEVQNFKVVPLRSEAASRSLFPQLLCKVDTVWGYNLVLDDRSEFTLGCIPRYHRVISTNT